MKIFMFRFSGVWLLLFSWWEEPYPDQLMSLMLSEKLNKSHNTQNIRFKHKTPSGKTSARSSSSSSSCYVMSSWSFVILKKKTLFTENFIEHPQGRKEPMTCVLWFGQQGPPQLVDKSLQKWWANKQGEEPKFTAVTITGYNVSVVSISANKFGQMAPMINLEVTSSITAAWLEFLSLVPEAPPGTILKVALVGASLRVSGQHPQLSDGETAGASASCQKGSWCWRFLVLNFLYTQGSLCFKFLILPAGPWCWRLLILRVPGFGFSW